MRSRRSHDLDHITVAKLIPQWNYSPVHLGSSTRQSDLGVYGEGEIHRSSSSGKLDYFPLRRKAVDFLWIEIELERIKEFSRVSYLLLPLDEALQPDKGFVFFGVGSAASFFVFPMRRNSFFGDRLHLLGANLDLEGLPALTHH